MPTELEEARPLLQQIWTWWQTLDDGVVRVLEGVASKAPQALAEVLGGSSAALLVPDGLTFADHLQAQLVASRPTSDGITAADFDVVLTGPVRLSSNHVAPGGSVSVDWEWSNRGRSIDGRVPAKVVLLDPDGQIVKEAEREFFPPEAGGSRAGLELEELPEGTWWVRLFAPYAPGMEFAPGADAATQQLRVGDPTSNAQQGGLNPADGFNDAGARFAAAAAALGSGDRETTGAEVGAALADIHRSLQPLGIAADRLLPNSPVNGGWMDVARGVEHLQRASTLALRLGSQVLSTLAAGGAVDALDDFLAMYEVLSELSRVAHTGAGEETDWRGPNKMRPTLEVGDRVDRGVISRIEGDTVFVMTDEGQELERSVWDFTDN